MQNWYLINLIKGALSNPPKRTLQLTAWWLEILPEQVLLFMRGSSSPATMEHMFETSSNQPVTNQFVTCSFNTPSN